MTHGKCLLGRPFQDLSGIISHRVSSAMFTDLGSTTIRHLMSEFILESGKYERGVNGYTQSPRLKISRRVRMDNLLRIAGENKL